jgi:ABC-type sugar transport system ATPase subunit
VPRDRRIDGVFEALSVFDNAALSALGEELCSRGFRRLMGIFSPARMWNELRPYAERLALHYSSYRAGIGSLSGGNQQKVILMRALATRPRVMVMDDPTRGVDPLTTQEVHRVLRSIADEGIACLMVSTELGELVALCDRVLVCHRGGIVAELARQELSNERLLAAMFAEATA